jgi:UDPglucose 6-dehydrogenase
MIKKSIAVIGQGFVGGSLSIGMCHAFDVYTFDAAGKCVDSQGRGKIEKGYPLEGGKLSVAALVKRVEVEDPNINFAGVYFVAVPTPMYEDGAADLSIVDSVLREFYDIEPRSINDKRIIVIKSTCPPGSTESWNKKYGDRLAVIFNPEFLREASAIEDFIHQNRIILGGPRPQINVVKQVYEIAYPDVPIIKTSSTTAEMVKYITNVHLATKVSLANEFYQICEALDTKGANIDYDKCIEYALYDDRLGTSHWKVPGPMPADDTGLPAKGFAGSCFIKDMNALMFLAKELGVDPKVMRGAWEKNLEVRPQRDWEKLIGRAVSKK